MELENYVVFAEVKKVVEKTKGWYKHFKCEQLPNKNRKNRWVAKCNICGTRFECATKLRLKQQIDGHAIFCRKRSLVLCP